MKHLSLARKVTSCCHGQIHCVALVYSKRRLLDIAGRRLCASIEQTADDVQMAFGSSNCKMLLPFGGLGSVLDGKCHLMRWAVWSYVCASSPRSTLAPLLRTCKKRLLAACKRERWCSDRHSHFFQASSQTMTLTMTLCIIGLDRSQVELLGSRGLLSNLWINLEVSTMPLGPIRGPGELPSFLHLGPWDPSGTPGLRA